MRTRIAGQGRRYRQDRSGGKRGCPLIGTGHKGCKLIRPAASTNVIAIFRQPMLVGLVQSDILELWAKDHLQQKRPETVVNDEVHTPNDREDAPHQLCPLREFIYGC